MPVTVPTNTELIDDIAAAAKDADFAKRDQATYARILTQQVDELNEEFGLLNKVDSSSLTLTADTELIGNLPDDFLRFTDMDNENGAGQVAAGTNGILPLKPTTIAQMDLLVPGWRSQSAGTPQRFFIVEGATVQLRAWPKPSSSWISSNGSAVYVHYVFVADNIAYDSSSPFNGAVRFRGIQKLLKLMSLRQIAAEDTESEKVIFYDKQIDTEKEKRGDILRAVLTVPGNVGFDPRSRTQP